MRAAWGAAVAERANECADAIDAMRGPGGLVSLREPQATAAGLTPWAVRFHVTEDDEDGKWEIWLPTGCMAVGETLTPINLAASEVSGHDGDEAGWYLVKLDEDEGSATPSTTGSGDDTVTTVSRTWEIIAHAKTSAKMYGADALDASARRLLYVSARKRRATGDSTPTAAQSVANMWGDEFSQVVARVTVGTRTLGQGQAQPFREIVRLVSTPISVQGRVRSNFDLVWYFSVDDTDGSLAVEKVYAVRISQAVAGLTVKGPTMTEVTDAEEDIYARITTNPESDAAELENVISVVCDPYAGGASPASGRFVTWLKLYDMAHNTVLADYRASSLVNVQTFR